RRLAAELAEQRVQAAQVARVDAPVGVGEEGDAEPRAAGIERVVQERLGRVPQVHAQDAVEARIDVEHEDRHVRELDHGARVGRRQVELAQGEAGDIDVAADAADGNGRVGVAQVQAEGLGGRGRDDGELR